MSFDALVTSVPDIMDRAATSVSFQQYFQGREVKYHWNKIVRSIETIYTTQRIPTQIKTCRNR